jgi:hypothetical protein
MRAVDAVVQKWSQALYVSLFIQWTGKKKGTRIISITSGRMIQEAPHQFVTGTLMLSGNWEHEACCNCPGLLIELTSDSSLSLSSSLLPLTYYCWCFWFTDVQTSKKRCSDSWGNEGSGFLQMSLGCSHTTAESYWISNIPQWQLHTCKSPKQLQLQGTTMNVNTNTPKTHLETF